MQFPQHNINARDKSNGCKNMDKIFIITLNVHIFFISVLNSKTATASTPSIKTNKIN